MKYLVTVSAIHEVVVEAPNKAEAGRRALDQGPANTEVTDVDVVTVERYTAPEPLEWIRPIDKFMTISAPPTGY